MAQKTNRGERDAISGGRQAWAIVLATLSVLAGLSQWSYQWTDISVLLAPAQNPPHNYIGPAGAWMAFVLLMVFGLASYLLPILGLLIAVCLWTRPSEPIRSYLTWGFVFLLATSIILDLQSEPLEVICAKLNIQPFSGGLLGYLVAEGLLVRLFRDVGAMVIAIVLLGASVAMIVGRPGMVMIGDGLSALVVSVVQKVRNTVSIRVEEAQLRHNEKDVLEDRRKRLQDTIHRKDRATAGRKASVASRGPLKDEAAVGPKLGSRRKKKDEDAVRKPIKEDVADIAEELPPEPVVEAPAPEEPKRPRKKLLSEVLRPPARSGAAAESKDAAPPATYESYVLPSVELLDAPAPPGKIVKSVLERAAQVLEETLSEFGIKAEVTDVQQGPVVTRYELLPAPGIRVERIGQLSNNIALALKATSVRVQAPVPGKGVVGIEIPNKSADIVYIREIMDDIGAKLKADVPLVLGKDVTGQNLAVDLAAMPHLLIAGATGAGKTVCMNSILGGILMTRTPEQVRLMLIDPKIVEFSAYNAIPHLVVPVITDPKKVAIGLRWAITEMEARYKMFAKVGVRNIKSFNDRPIIEQQDLFGEEEAAPAKKDEIPARVPFIVIVIDELADLMLVAQSDIENCIARLAQLSRAVGIHMIIATQRPSVNVITGTIKANFPARIAFQVAQKVDSRTILDTIGAEKLLGKGDMLYHPPGSSKLMRIQGAMITDEELRSLIDHVKEQAEPAYENAIQEKMKSSKASGGAPDTDQSDELIEQAVEIIRETQRASTSSLQRRLRIGYTRAARLMDVLEEKGIVGPPRGSDPREIMIDLDLEHGVPGAEEDAEEEEEEETEESASESPAV